MSRSSTESTTRGVALTLRIERRLARARQALDAAVEDMLLAGRRVERLRARVSRLEAVLRVPVEQRQARARRASETRRAVPAHRRRGIRLTEES